MKTIIAGGRTLTDYNLVLSSVAECGWQISEVVSGTEKGVDMLGDEWADQNDIPVKCFPADLETHGKAAGSIRNEQMAEYADALIAIWDGQSLGTRSMIEAATRLGLKVHVHRVD